MTPRTSASASAAATAAAIADAVGSYHQSAFRSVDTPKTSGTFGDGKSLVHLIRRRSPAVVSRVGGDTRQAVAGRDWRRSSRWKSARVRVRALWAEAGNARGWGDGADNVGVGARRRRRRRRRKSCMLVRGPGDHGQLIRDRRGQFIVPGKGEVPMRGERGVGRDTEPDRRADGRHQTSRDSVVCSRQLYQARWITCIVLSSVSDEITSSNKRICSQPWSASCLPVVKSRPRQKRMAFNFNDIAQPKVHCIQREYMKFLLYTLRTSWSDFFEIVRNRHSTAQIV